MTEQPGQHGMSGFEQRCTACGAEMFRAHWFVGQDGLEPGSLCTRCAARRLVAKIADDTRVLDERAVLDCSSPVMPNLLPSVGIMQNTTELWARERYAQVGQDVSLWAQIEWPLPVGKASLEDRCYRLYHGEPPRPLGGFSDGAWVALVVTKETTVGAVQLFCLVRPSGAPQRRIWQFEDHPLIYLPPYRSGIPEASDDVARGMAKKLATWYRRWVRGESMGGRPPVPDKAYIQDVFNRAYSHLKGRPGRRPLQKDLVAQMSVIMGADSPERKAGSTRTYVTQPSLSEWLCDWLIWPE